VEKIVPQELKLAADAEILIVREVQIVENIEMETEDDFGFAAGVGELAIGEGASDGQKMIGDALHGGDDHGDVGSLRCRANEACGMEHAVRAKKRAAAKLAGEDSWPFLTYPAGVVQAVAQRSGDTFPG
jgi:hypothetical protein